MIEEIKNTNENLGSEKDLENASDESVEQGPKIDGKPEPGHLPDIWERWDKQAKTEDEGKAPLPSRGQPSEKKTAPARKSGWEPIDLSKGRFKHEELYKMSKQNFEYNVRNDLKSVLPKFSQRQEVAKRISSIRNKDITKKELKRELKGLKEEGKLKPFQIKKLRRKFGAF